ncbi:cupin domain-containing protein [Halosimplex salinum]|uniref:cupin domain-containing protein n=1 Tax=Halosimplex salinum TaxID=1710538 RepID=UPI000F4A995E|nr:cupin domain-containing protein [Halosimplex salinum]
MSETDDADRYAVEAGLDGNLGAALRVAPADSESGVAVVEHTLPPETLAAPLHRHENEDEISYILEGRMGIQADDSVRTVTAGEFAVKERERWHTFWNPDTEPLRFLEIVAPGEFASYFEEMAALVPEDGDLDAEVRREIAELNETYDLAVKPDSVPDLRERHGLDG